MNVSSPSPSGQSHHGASWLAWLLLVLVTSLTIALDQLTKAFVVARLAPHESWMPLEFLEPYFRFTHIRNTGAAFGIFPQGGSIFLVIAVVVSAVVVYYYRQLPDKALLVRLALGLQLGGALGNAIDRLRQGYVVDFMNVEYWPVFNVADSAIVVGVVLLAFEMIREEIRAARQQRAERERAQKKTDSSEGEISIS